MSLKLNTSSGGSVTLQEPSTATAARVLELPDGDGPIGLIKRGTAVATTSGSSVDFTGIPSWAKRITIMFSGVSLSSTASLLVQLGDSGGIEATGYVGSGARFTTTAVAAAVNTTGFNFNNTTAAANFNGSLILTNINGNTWVAQGVIAGSATDIACISAGSKTLSAVLDRVRITNTSTNNFDAGTINVMWEG